MTALESGPSLPLLEPQASFRSMSRSLCATAVPLRIRRPSLRNAIGGQTAGAPSHSTGYWHGQPVSPFQINGVNLNGYATHNRVQC
jgi:hypothetical protein